MPMSNEEIKVAKTGLPFKSEEQATAELKRLELPADVWGVFPHAGGFAIRMHAAVLADQRANVTQAEDTARAKSISGEKYFWVEFGGKGSTQDTEKVEISWQGIRITVARETRVALPQRFLGVCDNAVQKLFEPAPRGENAYQPSGVLKRRSYRMLGEATREDFLKQWNEGNAITRSTVKASGGKPHEVSQAPV